MPLALPTNWTGHSLAVTGTISGFVPRADSPLYIRTGTTVNGYVATQSRVYTITDIGGARTLGTPYVYADGAAVNPNQVQIQTERGNSNWCLVAVYYDTLGTRVYRTIDGGTTWADENSLPTRYDNNLPNNAGNWIPGLWMNPAGNGNALVSVGRATANPPGADLYETNDYGATWAKVGTLDMGEWPSGSITKPRTRSDVIYHGYVDYSGGAAVCRVGQIIGTTQTDITPTVSGTTYGVPYATYAQRALSVADNDPNALVLVGYNVASAKWGVFQTFNALAAAPTWNTIITPATSLNPRGAYYVDRNTIYLIGDGGYLARCTYYGGTWAVDAQNGSGAGDLRGLCGL